jgi:hypothetical protein
MFVHEFGRIRFNVFVRGLSYSLPGLNLRWNRSLLLLTDWPSFEVLKTDKNFKILDIT